MENQDSNTQALPVANPPTPPEPNAAELQAKIAELEKQSEGRLRDLQSERAKRQELEAKVNPSASSAAPQNDVMQDELGKVLNPYIAPVMARVRQAEEFVANTYKDKAVEHLAKVTGKSKETVLNDKELGDRLTSIVNRFGLQGNVHDVTVRACEIMELENMKSADEARKRAAVASNNASIPTGIARPEVVDSKEFSSSEWDALSPHEYEKLSDVGTFKQGENGKIVYTRHK